MPRRVRIDGHLRGPRRRQPRRVLRRRRGRRSACGPSCCPARRRAGSSFAGATAGLDPADGPFLVVDIGGGSTEFIVGTTEAEGVVSVDIGCVRLTEQLPAPRPAAARGAHQRHLGVVHAISTTSCASVPGRRGRAARSSASPAPSPRSPPSRSAWPPTTATSIHHFHLTRAAAEDVFRTLATEPRPTVHNPGLEPERADVIVGGCCVLVGIMRGLHADSMVVSDSDLLDALVAGRA